MITDEHMSRLFTWLVQKAAQAVMFSLLGGVGGGIAGAVLGSGDGSAVGVSLALAGIGSFLGFWLPLASGSAPVPYALVAEQERQAQQRAQLPKLTS